MNFEILLSHEWIAAVGNDDIQHQRSLVGKYIADSESEPNSEEMYVLLCELFTWCMRNGIDDLAMSMLDRLLNIPHSATVDSSLLMAIAIWEHSDNISALVRLLEHHNTAELQLANLDLQGKDWWKFMELSVRLGLACVLNEADQAVRSILDSLRKYVYLGNLVQPALLKSLRIVIATDKFNDRVLINGKLSPPVSEFIYWLWADVRRAERFFSDRSGLPWSRKEVDSLLSAISKDV